MKSPQVALYVVGGVMVLMGLYGLVVWFGWLSAMAGVEMPVWVTLLDLVLGAWALWVGMMAKE